MMQEADDCSDFLGTAIDSFSYDRNGYEQNGYERNGYEHNGYERNGYERNAIESDSYSSPSGGADGRSERRAAVQISRPSPILPHTATVFCQVLTQY